MDTDRQNSIGFTIRRMSNLLRRKMAELAPPPEDRDGMTDMGCEIMEFLCEHVDRELFQRDVEEVFCIRRSTASRFLQKLERDGLLLRQSVARDARLKKLVPTERALALHSEVGAKSQVAESLMARDLTPEELARFLATAKKIQENLAR